MDTELQEMLEHYRITKLVNEYCHGCDRGDGPRMGSVYAEVSWDDHGMYLGDGKAFADSVMEGRRERGEVMSHHLGQTLVKVDGDEPGVVDLKRLINVVTRREKRVEVPNSDVVLQRDDVRDAIKAAIITGFKEKKRNERDANKLEAPIDIVKDASSGLRKAIEAVKTISGDPEFDQKRRKSLEAAFNKLKRGMRDLSAALVKAKVIEE